MKMKKSVCGLLAFCVIVLLAVAGCDNPPGPPKQDTAKDLLQELLGPGCTIVQNSDGTFTIGNFDGTIPVPAGWTSNTLTGPLKALLSNDGTCLELEKLEADPVDIILLGNDPQIFTIRRVNEKYVIIFPDNSPHIIMPEGNFHVVGPYTPVLSVGLNRNELPLTPGGTEKLNATIIPATATIQDVVWTSSAPEIADVDQTGTVTAYAAGSADITATAADGGKTAKCTVTVTVPPLTDDINVAMEWDEDGFTLISSPDSITVNRGDKSVIAAPSGIGPYRWYVNGSLVQESENGNEYVFDSAGYAVNTYTVSLRAGSGQGDSVKITVR